MYIPEHFYQDLLKSFQISLGLFRTFSIFLFIKSNILQEVQWNTCVYKKSNMLLGIVLKFVDWDIFCFVVFPFKDFIQLMISSPITY